METGIKEIIKKGKNLSVTSTERENKTIGTELQERVAGEKAFFMFTCPSCSTEYTTKNRYRTEGNYFFEMGRYKIENAVYKFIRNIVGIDRLKDIPVIGSTLFNRYGYAYNEKVQKSSDVLEAKLLYRFQKAAFKDVVNNFIKSKTSGEYCCKACDQ